MKIVIFGLSKSGTTALFYKIKESLPPDTCLLFEPRRFTPQVSDHVLAKVLPFKLTDPPEVESFGCFEKQILIVRDPRDRLISKLLYSVYDSRFVNQDRKVKSFIESLRRKEADSQSVSVQQLLETFAKLNGEEFSLAGWSRDYRQHSIQIPMEFHDQRPSLSLFRYEDLIDQRLEALEEFLGLKLKQGEVSVEPGFERVTRTKSYGNWRDWFTANDVAWLHPLLEPYLQRYYPEADWTLAPTPLIHSAHSSEYVARIVNERRRLSNVRPFE